jgi:hypothetical protein
MFMHFSLLSRPALSWFCIMDIYLHVFLDNSLAPHALLSGHTRISWLLNRKKSCWSPKYSSLNSVDGILAVWLMWIKLDIPLL